MSVSERYKGIDIFKLVCIFLVIMIHVAPFGGGVDNPANYVLQKIVSRISVPFFFTASGFLLFRKFPENEYDGAKIKKYVLSILKLYIVWTLIYSPFIVHGILTDKRGLLVGALKAARNFLMTGSYTHLWYLNALIVAVLLVCLLLNRGMKINGIMIVSSVLFLTGLLGQSYFGLLLPLSGNEKIWAFLKTVRAIIGTTRDGLFEGMFFVAMGAFFAWNKDRICRGHNSILLPLIAVGMLLCEGLLIKKYGHPLEWNTYICSSIAVFCLFRYAIDPRRQWSISDSLGMWIRNIVEIVFLVHLWVRAIADIILPRLSPRISDSFIRYLFVAVVSFAVSEALLYLSERKAFAFLKHIL